MHQGVERVQGRVVIANFGNKIWNRSDEVRKHINGELNPLFIFLTRNKSGSGHNFNAVLEGIRVLPWPMEVISRARTNSKTAMSRLRSLNKAGNRTSIPGSSLGSSSSLFNSNDLLEETQENSEGDPNAGIAFQRGVAKGRGLGGETTGAGVGGGGGGTQNEDTENVDEQLPAYKELYATHYRKLFIKGSCADYLPHFWITFLLIGRPGEKQGRPYLEAGRLHIFILILSYTHLLL